MAWEELSAWIMGVMAVAAYSVYAAIVLGRAGDVPLADVPYAATLLWTIGGSIVGSIVVHIVVGMFRPGNVGRKDQRDREISRVGEHIGQSFLVIGALAAMLMALLELDHFWIANAIYLGFVLSAVLGSIARIMAYRRGFQTW